MCLVHPLSGKSSLASLLLSGQLAEVYTLAHVAHQGLVQIHAAKGV